MKRHLILLFSAALAISQAPFAYADKLKDLTDSPEYRETVRGSGPTRVLGDIDRESNYAKLFDTNGAKPALFKALGEELDGFKIVQNKIRKHDQYLLASRVYETFESKRKVTLTVVLPYPEYLTMVQQGLILGISQLHPDAADIETEGQIEIQGEKGELVQVKDGKAYCFLKLPKEAILIASIETPKSSPMLTKLLQLITIGELKRELNS